MRKLAALLRAVNVGGRKLAMSDLKAILTQEGFEKPETLLASGNAVFGTDAPAAKVESRLETALSQKLGLATDVLVRDGPQLAAILAGNPFARMAAEDPSHLTVLFVKDDPKTELEVLKPYCGLGEQAAPGPGCLYITYPGGIGVSELLLTVLEKRLSVVGTARNWNTVCKLAERVG